VKIRCVREGGIRQALDKMREELDASWCKTVVVVRD
jgi:hypothetical protein